MKASNSLRASVLVGALSFAVNPLYAESLSIQPHRDRYYEGEQACVGIHGKGQARLRWQILGKDLGRQALRYESDEDNRKAICKKVPEGLKAMTPLSVELLDAGSPERLLQRVVVQLYPRDPKYYLYDPTLKAKRIALEDPSGRVRQELDGFGLSYDKVRMDQMPLKRYDLYILVRSTPPASDFVPADGAPVIQLDVTMHLDHDPLTRQLLAERIRSIFRSETVSAKESPRSVSNP